MFSFQISSMDNFYVNGSHSSNQHNLKLKLPSAKHFEIGSTKNADETLKTEKLILSATKRFRNKYSRHHTQPEIPTKKYETLDVPQTLQNIFIGHPFPLSQGPVLPVNCAVEMNTTQTDIEILESKTTFCHDEAQNCGEWKPIISGISSWNKMENDQTSDQVTYKVDELECQISGPATSRAKENILYTCYQQTCVIHCSCSICGDVNSSCQCRMRKCEDCNSQCKKHYLNLTRKFNPKTDHYTIVTDKIDAFRFAVPYSGIPLECDLCSKDVLEHQVLHLVLHMNCKFCQYDFRPFKEKTIKNVAGWSNSNRLLLQNM